MRGQIFEIVKESVNSLNELLDNKVPYEKGDSCELYGASGLLDSISLVSLVVAIEEKIESEFNISIILASEKAMSQRKSPFSTIASLVNYIEILLNQEMTHA